MVKISWRVWLLIIAIMLSLLSIFGFPPTFAENGVLIKSVEQNSTAFEAGLRAGHIIKSVDGQEIGTAILKLA